MPQRDRFEIGYCPASSWPRLPKQEASKSVRSSYAAWTGALEAFALRNQD